MSKNKSEESNELRNSSLSTLLNQRWRFPHKADFIDREFKKSPTEELRRERKKLKLESTKLREEYGKVTSELKAFASSSEMQWWKETAGHIAWWDLERVAKVARDPRFSVLEKQRDMLRKSRHIGMRLSRVSAQISLLNSLLRESRCPKS